MTAQNGKIGDADTAEIMLNDSAASKRKPKERNVKDFIIAFILVSMAKIMIISDFSPHNVASRNRLE